MHSYVFNAKDIEGIPELPKIELQKIDQDQIIETISKNMGVEVINDGGDNAYYKPSEDKIHVPEAGYFENDYAYNSTVLHELAHATGAAKRLNRDQSGIFGSLSYAYEELIAEISSSFMGNELTQTVTEFEMSNHKAYVKGWISDIKDKPDTLIKAIKEAEKCSDYLTYQAELMSEKEYMQTLNNPDEIDKDGKPIENKEETNNKELINTIKEDILRSGFKPNEKLVNQFLKLNELTGKTYTLKNVKEIYKNYIKSENEEVKKVINLIADECKYQQLHNRELEKVSCL